MENFNGENSAKLENNYRASLLIVLFQIVFTIILIVISWIIVQNYDGGVSARIVLPLWILIIFIAAGSLILRGILFRPTRLKDVFVKSGVEGLFRTLKTNTIFLGSIAEIISVVGFVIAVMSGLKYEMFRAGAVAFMLFLINFPRKSAWKKISVQIQKSAGDI